MFSSNYQSATELTTPLSCPFVIPFHVRLRSTVASISNIPVDVWANSSRHPQPTVPTGRRVPRRRGDFRCSPLPYLHPQPASPAAMFANAMNETVTGWGRIEDVGLFQHIPASSNSSTPGKDLYSSGLVSNCDADGAVPSGYSTSRHGWWHLEGVPLSLKNCHCTMFLHLCSLLYFTATCSFYLCSISFSNDIWNSTLILDNYTDTKKNEGLRRRGLFPCAVCTDLFFPVATVWDCSRAILKFIKMTNIFFEDSIVPYGL